MSATFADIHASLFAGLTSVFCKKDHCCPVKVPDDYYKV